MELLPSRRTFCVHVQPCTHSQRHFLQSHICTRVHVYSTLLVEWPLSCKWTCFIVHYYRMTSSSTTIAWLHRPLLSHVFIVHYYRMSSSSTTIAWLHRPLLSHVFIVHYYRMTSSSTTIACLHRPLLSHDFIVHYYRMTSSSTTIAWLHRPLLLHAKNNSFCRMGKTHWSDKQTSTECYVSIANSKIC